MYKVISFGSRCSSSDLIKLLNLKTESYPFDWLVSKLDVIKDCIETNFINFLDLNNYVVTTTETFNMTDCIKTHICNEGSHVNTYYEKYYKNNISTYDYKLLINHKYLNDNNNFEYYKRCINRLYDLFNSDVKKYYIYFHHIMGLNDYENNKENIFNEFDNFSEYIITKTKNIFGLYFILIKHNHKQNIKSYKIKETSYYKIFIIYCNDDFIDAGRPFYGNCKIEEEEILSILRLNLQ